MMACTHVGCTHVFFCCILIIVCQYQFYMVSESGTIAASNNALLSPLAAFPFETPNMWASGTVDLSNIE